jgi:cyclin-dependent kinase 10
MEMQIIQRQSIYGMMVDPRYNHGYFYSLPFFFILRSAGCIMGELLQHRPLLPGTTEQTQLNLIVKLLGTPNEHIWPGFTQLPLGKALLLPKQDKNTLKLAFPRISDQSTHLLAGLLTYNPRLRLNVRQALQHPYFRESPRGKDTTGVGQIRYSHTFPLQHKTHPCFLLIQKYETSCPKKKSKSLHYSFDEILIGLHRVRRAQDEERKRRMVHVTGGSDGDGNILTKYKKQKIAAAAGYNSLV